MGNRIIDPEGARFSNSVHQLTLFFLDKPRSWKICNSIVAALQARPSVTKLNMKVLFVFAIIAFVVVANVAADDCSTDCDDANPLSDTANGKAVCCDPQKYDMLAIGNDPDSAVQTCECF
ncbi:hypothetical protein RRG08_035010 [Elysia crispata]|uniref:Uncharacterized protein n=1 Tax=Elysia crispata TaxID=231223 RepID=A0AAE0ZSF2_9GAST|nr:hypothetical protein RRG08_035010 [Elysia crispata]